MPLGDWLISLQEATEKLPDQAAEFRFHYALRRGSLKVGLYAPLGRDAQGPHTQDELYVALSGNGSFVKNDVRRPFSAHDAIFVEAGAEHRFEDFSADFSAWVIFWGPPGGEIPERS